MKRAILATRFLVYLILLSLYIIYNILQTITKPGTRSAFPVFLFALLSPPWFGDRWFPFFYSAAGLPLIYVSGNPLIYLTIGGIIYLAVIWATSMAYRFLSRALGVLLGIFPTPSQPILPRKPLEVPKEADRTPAAVKVAVRPLQRPRRP